MVKKRDSGANCVAKAIDPSFDEDARLLFVSTTDVRAAFDDTTVLLAGAGGSSGALLVRTPPHAVSSRSPTSRGGFPPGLRTSPRSVAEDRFRREMT